ncbi:MAG: TIGR04282 family arsenosugar biosynthesis glycosyltransferase [Nitrospirales bacterium]
MALSGKHPPKKKPKRHKGGHSKPLQPAEAALIIFTKSPVPGLVKTRLCPPLAPDEAATLHGSLVLDTLERTRNLQGFDRFLACAPSKQHPFFQTVGARQQIELWEQISDADLGKRMDCAFGAAFERKYTYAVLIGSDLPSIDGETIQQAVRALAEHDVVIGPSVDGGYYLIGLKQPTPELFSNIPWSTDQVSSLTQQIANHLELSMKFLPEQRDLDTIEDLQVFIQESQGSKTSVISSRTAQVLKTLATRLVNRE